MKVFVYDHESLVRERLERIVLENGYEIINHNLDFEIATLIQQHQPHILLLSKNTPNLSTLCAQFSQHKTYNPAIIVIGDKEDNAALAFKMGICDYLASPVSKEELTCSLVKVCRLNAAQVAANSQQGQGQKPARQYIAARTHRGVELIAMADVYYFTADQKYVKIRHKNGMVLIDETLKDLEEEFAGMMFRIHRNALVNLDYLDLLELVDSGQYQVRFRGVEEALAVSRRHLPALREKIHSI